jgi:hypothetical protein
VTAERAEGGGTRMLLSLNGGAQGAASGNPSS